MRDAKAMMRGIVAVGRHREWWIALGQATPENLILGGVARPWRDRQEYDDWQQWRCGSDRFKKAARLVQAYPEGPPKWWINLAQRLSEPVQFGLRPDWWDDPTACPNIARLAWVPLWPWRSDGAGWEDPVARRPARSLPGLAPWMEGLASGQPITLGAWYKRADVEVRRSFDKPWLIQILVQTVLLQALGGGYWDYRPGPRETW